MTAYRIEHKTVCEERQETRYRPVWETATRECRYTVARPVIETSLPRRALHGRSAGLRDADSGLQLQPAPLRPGDLPGAKKTIPSTVRCPKPQQREEWYTVRRPVTRPSTARMPYGLYNRSPLAIRSMSIRAALWTRPWSSGLLARQPAPWLPAGTTSIRPPAGPVYRRAGLYWAPVVPHLRVNPAVAAATSSAYQVPQTTYVAKVVSRASARADLPLRGRTGLPHGPLPDLPDHRGRARAEVPYTTCQPVVERVERKVPVQVCHMVAEQYTRKVPVNTCRMVYEEHVDRVPYKTCRMVAYQETVRVPHCVEKRIPVTYTCTVPHTVCCRVPINACGQGAPDESLVPTTTQPATHPATGGEPTPAVKRPSDADVPPALPAAGEGPQPHRSTQSRRLSFCCGRSEICRVGQSSSDPPWVFRGFRWVSACM